MVELAWSPLRRRRSELDDVYLVHTNRLFRRSALNEYVPVVSGTAIDVWASPPVAVEVDPSVLRCDGAERNCRTLPPMGGDAEWISGSVGLSGQAPVEARGPAFAKVARVVDAEHLARADTDWLHME